MSLGSGLISGGTNHAKQGGLGGRSEEKWRSQPCSMPGVSSNHDVANLKANPLANPGSNHTSNHGILPLADLSVDGRSILMKNVVNHGGSNPNPQGSVTYRQFRSHSYLQPRSENSFQHSTYLSPHPTMNVPNSMFGHGISPPPPVHGMRRAKPMD